MLFCSFFFDFEYGHTFDSGYVRYVNIHLFTYHSNAYRLAYNRNETKNSNGSKPYGKGKLVPSYSITATFWSVSASYWRPLFRWPFEMKFGMWIEALWNLRTMFKTSRALLSCDASTILFCLRISGELEKNIRTVRFFNFSSIRPFRQSGFIKRVTCNRIRSLSKKIDSPFVAKAL